jgi:alpha-glucosidase
MRIRVGIFILLWVLLPGEPLRAEVQRVKFPSGGQYLIVETLDDDLVHFELSAVGDGPDASVPLYTSPMIDKTDYSGPAAYAQNGGVIETSQARVSVNTQSLCVSITDKIRSALLTTICPLDLGQAWKGLTLAREQMQHVYGLGQQFKVLGSADGDWISHRVREEQPAGQEQSHGNGFMPFGPAGLVGNVQLPVMYAVGSSNLNYAFLLDNVYKQRWEFTGDPWKVQMWGDQIRFYVMLGPDLPDLRQDYLELVGRPPVPPRKAFGLWVSEFGYKNWPQIARLKTGLRSDHFPVDGFVLDLQWFGGIIAGNPDSPMGRLDWDLDNFPDPDGNIAGLLGDQVGLVAIEESYVNEHTATYRQMLDAGARFASMRVGHQCDPGRSTPVSLTNWFGKAGMIDWSNPDTGAWIHDNRRFPNLVSKGILGHWTDLGEPEKYDGTACYTGVETTPTGPKSQHGDIHNLYNFLWNRSIYDGYRRRQDTVNRRPFIVSRSGAAGSARFGVAMWSGDIGSSLQLLATHLNSQMHMTFSGIDYYGSDIGGFRREGIPYNTDHAGNLQYQNELYTQWFANGTWFDVPVRPHTDNSFQTRIRYETAPNLVGVPATNLANLRQRYELTPYYYSLAYRAYLAGEPLIAPLVFYYQNDPNVRQMGHQKLIGRDLLVAVVARHGEYQRDVYLPAGTWVNYHTNEWFTSSGQIIKDFPVYLDWALRLPAFARAGAILPAMFVDDKTKDVFGHRKDGTSRNELLVRVYADSAATQFTLYEDDGSSVSYDTHGKPVYQTRSTPLSQQQTGRTVRVAIGAVSGSFPGAVSQRDTVVRLIVKDARATRVSLNGTPLSRHPNETAFNSARSGWVNAGLNTILAKSGVRSVSAPKTFVFTLQPVAAATSVNFVCDNGWTSPGENVYVVGNTPQLGSWNPNSAVRLYPSVYHEYIYNPPPNHNGPGPTSPKWTRLIQGLPASTSLEWKCLKRLNFGQWHWQPGSNNTIALPASGFAGTSAGAF